MGEFGGAGESGDLKDISFGESVRPFTNTFTALLSLLVQLRDHRRQAQVGQVVARLLIINLSQRELGIASVLGE